jgi:hypothetical protein
MDALKEIKEKNLYTKEPAPEPAPKPAKSEARLQREAETREARRKYAEDALEYLKKEYVPAPEAVIGVVKRTSGLSEPDKLLVGSLDSADGRFGRLDRLVRELLPFEMDGFSEAKKRRWLFAFNRWWDIWSNAQPRMPGGTHPTLLLLQRAKREGLFGAKQVGETASFNPY